MFLTRGIQYPVIFFLSSLTPNGNVFPKNLGGLKLDSSSWGKVRSDSRLDRWGFAVVNQIHTHYMIVSKNRGTPKWIDGLFSKSPLKMDDLGVPLFLETPTSRI